MSTASHSVYPETYLRTRFFLFKKVPLSMRWILLSVLIFSLSAAASYEQSAMNTRNPSHAPSVASPSKTTTLQVVSDQGSDNGSAGTANVAPSVSTPSAAATQQAPDVTPAMPATPATTCTTSTIPYQTSYVDDPSIPKGEQSVTTYGMNGYTVTCTGVPSNTVPPVNEVVSIGTYIAPPTVPAPAAVPVKTYQEAQQYCGPLLDGMDAGSSSAMAVCINDYLHS